MSRALKRESEHYAAASCQDLGMSAVDALIAIPHDSNAWLQPDDWAP